MYILGISAYYHDSAAALIKDGEIVAAAQEERFTRIKHDMRFPQNAISYCLSAANISLQDVSFVTFYDKPLIKFERLLETYIAYAPKGIKSFVMSMPIWLKDKLFLKTTLKKELQSLCLSEKKISLPKLLFTEHHQAHAASAFFPSPYEKAAVLCLDGVGEWATTTVWKGEGNKLELQWEIDFPHSLGLLYSAFTYYTGFKVNSGEYKIMGLAPYGAPKYVDLIYKYLIDLKADGTFRLNMNYFNYACGLTMTNDKFHRLFGGPPRTAEAAVTQKEMDLARSIQVVTEEVVLRLGKTIKQELGLDYLCLAGGVALNCVANGRLLREGPFKDIWIQPAAGDAGGALGAAFATWYEFLNHPRNNPQNNKSEKRQMDQMQGAYLGPSFHRQEIEKYLKSVGATYELIDEDKALFKNVSQFLGQGKIVGWFQGRMEFGPRALGARSILGDPRNIEMQSIMNLKIKYRESFRPFAPAVLAEDLSEYFKHDRPSPYMLMVAEVQDKIKKAMSEQELKQEQKLFGIAKLNIARSEIPAITHVDYSARIQTVHRETNARFWSLLNQFKQDTGCSVLVNTSFNVRGEPIVCTPEDAYRCFMRTEMDYLVLENIVLKKEHQPLRRQDDSWTEEFQLD